MELVATIVALAFTVIANILFLGFIYGKMVTRLDDLSRELRVYVRRTDDTILRMDAQVRDHETRITRLEAVRTLPGVLA